MSKNSIWKANLHFSMDWQMVSPRATSTALVVHLVIRGLFSKRLMYLWKMIDIFVEERLFNLFIYYKTWEYQPINIGHNVSKFQRK